jgi:arylsulfatase A-like enzyme
MMKKKNQALLYAAAVPVLLYGAVKEPTAPNVILVLIDDMGWADSDLYGSGYYETPNMRRLAKEGMLFTDAYAAAPLCSPTRASIMSGQHPARIRMTTAITTKGSVFEPVALPPEEGRYCGNVQSGDHLPAGLRTLADLLRAGGYQTAHIGKWHLSRPNQFAADNKKLYDAGNRGFDFVIGGDHLPGPPDYYSPYNGRSKDRENRTSEIPNLDAGPEGEYLDQRLADEAINWMESVKDSERPFFLNFWHYTVHTPIIPRRDLLAKYRNKTDPFGIHDCPEMATMIQSMDESLGMLLDYLDRPENQAMRDNTLLIFLSDNGGVIHIREKNRLLTSNRPLRGGKANTYEGGIRVPWLVRYPGQIKAGTRSDVPVVSTDLFPTLLDYAGVPLPQGQAVDGRSLRPLWEGGAIPEEPLFFDFPHIFGMLCAPSAAVRLGDYKLLRFYWAGDEPGTHYYELFNLRKDPFEAVNLAAYMLDTVRELDALIEKHLQETGALVPMANKNGIGAPRTSRNKTTNRDRPASLHLDEEVVTLEERTGRRIVQLKDENGKPCPTHAIVLSGTDWVEVETREDGSVEVRWDRSKGSGAARILLGWRGGRSAWETNDWSFDPVELILN